MDPDSHPSMHNSQGYHGREKAMEENAWRFSGPRPGSEAHHF